MMPGLATYRHFSPVAGTWIASGIVAVALAMIVCFPTPGLAEAGRQRPSTPEAASTPRTPPLPGVKTAADGATKTIAPKEGPNADKNGDKAGGQNGDKNGDEKPEMTMEEFLDRLMVAESNGNDNARNPLSSATGAFQFIEATFLSVMERHFPERVAKLDTAEILELRKDRKIARDAARAFTRDNATYLVAAGHKPTFPHLRLAFLLGAGGATRILDAKPETPLVGLLSGIVIRANPWMARYTAQSLVARAARDVSLSPTTTAGAKPRIDPKTGKLILTSRVSRRPAIRVRCNLARPSCKRWLSLKRRSLARKRSGKSSRQIAQTKP